MHEKIMNFSSTYFYMEKLFPNEKVRDWKIYNEDEPVEFIDTAGAGFFEQADPETKSSFNKDEVNLLFIHFQNYMDQIQSYGKMDEVQNIGIISPYKAQVGLLKDQFDVIFKDD